MSVTFLPFVYSDKHGQYVVDLGLASSYIPYFTKWSRRPLKTDGLFTPLKPTGRVKVLCRTEGGQSITQ